MFQIISFRKKGVFTRKSPIENANDWLAKVGDGVRVIATNPVTDEEGRILELILTYEAGVPYTMLGVRADEKPGKRKGLFGLIGKKKDPIAKLAEKEKKEEKERAKREKAAKEKAAKEKTEKKKADAEETPGIAEIPTPQSPQSLAPVIAREEAGPEGTVLYHQDKTNEE
ncbi:MAG: hypothetical protein LBQ97_06245 [Fusobacteriaceae bacterium]|jgi:hypothetical protein|nr:hypothetical protein [Fusobacteriaceae bacterium]